MIGRTLWPPRWDYYPWGLLADSALIGFGREATPALLTNALLQALQYFLAIAPPVEPFGLTRPKAPKPRKLDHRSENLSRAVLSRVSISWPLLASELLFAATPEGETSPVGEGDGGVRGKCRRHDRRGGSGH